MKYAVVNLGCKVNRVESDAFASSLDAHGAKSCDAADADLIVVNTCTVTGEAEKKTRKAVRGALRANDRATVIVTGCAAAIDKDTPSEDEYPSLSFWLIPHDLPGIRAVPINKIGQSMVPFASVSFDEVELKPEYRLRGHEGGFRHLFKMLEFGRVFTCAASLGMAQAAMEDAVANARVRKAFGVSIGQFQQVEQMLTDMEVSLRTMRSMLYQAAWAIETDQPDKRLAVALMKRYIPKTATEVASSAMQILGGLGYTDSARVSTIWQDCRGNQIAEGTDQIMVYISAPLIMKEYE